MANSKIKVGSKVVITNPGRTYTTYDDMFRLLGFKNTEHNEAFLVGMQGTVFAVENHLNWPNDTLYAVQDAQGNQCLINVDGIDLVSDPEDQFDVIKAFCTDMKLDITSEDIYKYLLRKLS
jgi:hypothetical protein